MSSDGAGKNMPGRIWLMPYFVLLLMIAVAGALGTGYLCDRARLEIIENNESRISLHASHLTAEFEKIEKTVKIMSGSPWIMSALVSGKEQDIANANSVLDRYNSSLESSVCYLMDGNGKTIASSNRNSSDSFVGKTYQFRPYFIQAIKGAPGRYFALGATSLKRGFYSSYPVGDGKGGIIGVVVIKQDVDAEEDHFSLYPDYFVTDPNGIIFLSGRKEMKFKTLWPVSMEKQLALLESKQFGKIEFAPLLAREVEDGTEILFEGEKHLVSRKVINPEGWSIIMMTTTGRVFIYGLAGVIITVSACVLVIVWMIIGIRNFKAAEMIKESELRHRQLFERNLAGVYRTTIEGRLLDCNESFAGIYGYNSLEDIMKHAAEDFHPNPEARQEFIAELQKEGKLLGYESRGRKKDGSLIWLLENTMLVPDKDGRLTRIEGTLIDITGRKLAEESVVREKDFTQAIINSLPGFFYVFDEEGKFLRWNKNLEEVSGYTEDEIVLMSPLDFFDEEEKQEIAQAIRKVFVEGQASIEADFITKEQGRIPCFFTGKRFIYENKPCVTGMGIDITERRSAEAERAKLEEQYRQAQKMEAVGQLAGGIAHDFNNMLNIILGYSEMALMKLEPSGLLYNSIREIKEAAGRSADLVRQLLAFARKQTIAPKPLDLNDTVAGMLNMLRRLIGEDIDLLWKPAADLWPVKMDPAQIDQILANLMVNARDSITGAGKITIETGKTDFDEAYCSRYSDYVPGQYVMLAVSDNGCGMDKEICGQIFEPFFTTKETGKGTGMGLATVYGIIKQNKGFINVYSEPGKGTTFKIYLPCFMEGGKSCGVPREHSEPILTGTGTILLVEDNEALLDMSKMMLEELGYTVLIAGGPVDAVKLARQYADEIHLVVTDVVMPDMSGRDLLKLLGENRPGIKCLFMSGYTANVIAHQGILDEGVNFLQKPFLMNALAIKVREAMGEKRES